MSRPRLSISDLYDRELARIKHAVEQELPGCSAIFDLSAWPLFRFHIQNSRGKVVARPQPFSLAELDDFTDAQLGATIRALLLK